MTLTIHSDVNRGICHWCGYQKVLKKTCEVCGEKEFIDGGIGTKELEIQVNKRFPEARIRRLDRDQTAKREVLPETLRDFADGKFDILIGTQMISKGIDIPKLTTVGVVMADQGWSVPDFRAMEKSFQLLKQLRGRAGRRGQASRMVIQTFLTSHPVFTWLQDEKAFEMFAEEELKIRKMADLPPFTKLCMWTFSHRDQELLDKATNGFAEKIRSWAKNLGVVLVGPAIAPLSRWKGQFRMHLLAKAAPKGHLTAFMTTVLDELERNPIPVQVKLDRDPYQFL